MSVPGPGGWDAPSTLAPMPNPERTVWVALPVHTVVCGAVLFAAEVALTPLDPDGAGGPLGYPILAAFTTIVALVFGLPFRLAPPLIRWWLRNGTATQCFLAVSMLVLASAFFVGNASTKHEVLETGAAPITVHVPDDLILGIGWFLFAVALTHLWWPYRFLSPSMRATLDAARRTRTPLPGPIGRR